MERFSDGDDIRDFCRRHRLDGLELLPYGENSIGKIPADLVFSVHLSSYNHWVDFWNGKEEGVLEEYRDWATARRVIGKDKGALVAQYRAQLDFAESLGARYVVFHVADVSIPEFISHRFTHTDAEVIDASLELINELLADGGYSFQFLVENLWWPGFTMKDKKMTRRLLDGIRYQNKGIMFDTGHLLHTDNDLKTEDEAVDYIHRVLDDHADLCREIKGVHLQQSLSGDYVKALLADPPRLKDSYDDRVGQIFEHIHTVDAHQPFTAQGVKGLIDRLNPDFLVYEFCTRSRAEHEDFLARQNAALGR